MTRARLLVALQAILAVLAVVSIVQGVRNALHVGTDFQWSPVLLLSQGQNPYEVALAGDPDHKILLTQQPPYLHLLYIVMLPLAALGYEAAKLVWAFVNIALGIGSVALIARAFRLTSSQAVTLGALFFLSTPFRNGLGNGQTALLCLFAALLAWAWRDRRPVVAGLSLSLMLVKYSFAPAFGLWLLVERRWRLLAASVVALIVGWLAFAGLVRQNPLGVLTEPLKVANMYAAHMGGGDVMTLFKSFGLDREGFGPVPLGGIAGLALAVVWVALLKGRAAKLPDATVLTAVSLISLVSIRHLSYDYVFLLPAAALCFHIAGASRAFLIAALIWFGFALKVVDAADIGGRWVEAVNFVVLNLMLVATLASGGRAWRA